MICAHSANISGDRHTLVDHLRAVAQLASGFAAPFAAAQPAYYAGLWHDLGKFHPRFQDYLRRCEVDPKARGHGPDHKAAGAQLAAHHCPPLALAIQGHHGGLNSPTHCRTWLAERTADPATAAALSLAHGALPDLLPSAAIPVPPHLEQATAPGASELWLRLLFSALVDADWLDTERHFQAERAALRNEPAALSNLWERLEADQTRLMADRTGAVAAARQAVYAACLAAAEQPPGLFRLTVPTGGGKTRSALAFALRHALRHGLQRVIVAVPFITITEQIADVYRGIFGAGTPEAPTVLEHHSAAERDGADGEDFHRARVWSRLAAENWDAPIIVTTTVQLFESLFAHTPRATRKLHRLAGAVLILDEVQALPPPVLTPILDVLRELCSHCSTTAVLSTATQPAFQAIEPFAALPAREIVPEPARHFAALQRVTYEWHTDPPLSWEAVAEWLRETSQALAVVNTKRDALALLDALGDPAVLHLSTLLCGAHRRAVLGTVRARLDAGQPCRLIATQVVEAGVDLDFPLVLRALAPLDGIIQAAGRCNREGRLARGRVIVFQPADGGLPPGYYTTGANGTRTLLGAGPLDLDDPTAAHAYFQWLYARVNTDAHAVQQPRAALDYPEVARRFRMIDDDTLNVVVPYGSAADRDTVAAALANLRRGTPAGRAERRVLQPYLVALRRAQAARYARQGLLVEAVDGLGEWQGDYHPVRGIVADDLAPDKLVI